VNVNTSAVMGASSSSGAPVSFSVDSSSSGVCSVNESDSVSFEAPGICQVDYFVPAYAAYGAASASEQFVVQAPDSVTFSPLPTSPIVGQTFPVSGTTAAGLPVEFSVYPSATGVCSIANGVVTLISTGSCVIQGQSPTIPFYVGGAYTEGISVEAQPQSIVFADPPSAPGVGDAYQVSAVSSSLSPVNFSIDPSTAGACTLSSWTVTFTGAGPCQVDASVASTTAFEGAESSQIVIVVGDAQNIYFSSPPPNPVVGGTYMVSATSDSGAAVTLSVDQAASGVCSLNNGTVDFESVGSCQIDGSVPLSGVYAAASSSETFTIKPALVAAVTSVTPDFGTLSGGTHITITGKRFIAGDTVVILQGHGTKTGEIEATHVKVVSPTQISAVTGKGTKSGTFNLLVINPANVSSSAVAKDEFTYRASKKLK
jgi:large repetitive protein